MMLRDLSGTARAQDQCILLPIDLVVRHSTGRHRG